MANPGNVVVLAKHKEGKGLTQHQAIATANRRRLTILSNEFLGRRLASSDSWDSEKEVYPVWSGTLLVYVGPDKEIKRFISYQDPDTNTTYVFEAPNKAVGTKGIALAVNHLVDVRGRPLIEYKNKGEKQVLVKIHDMSKIGIVEDFPKKNGWYLTEGEFGIPSGAAVDRSNENAKYLNRVDTYAGLLAGANYYFYGHDYGRCVDSGRQPSLNFGVLAWRNAAPAAEPAMK